MADERPQSDAAGSTAGKNDSKSGDGKSKVPNVGFRKDDGSWNWQRILITVACYMVASLIINYFWPSSGRKVEEKSVSNIGELTAALQAKEIAKLYIIPEEERQYRVEVDYVDGSRKPVAYSVPDIAAKDVLEAAKASAVAVTSSKPHNHWTDRLWSLGKWILIGIGILLLVGLIGESMGMLEDFEPQTSDLKFDNVGGADEAKTALMGLVEFISHPERAARLGAVMPKGALLVGPPGTGKTLLAKALAGEAGVPFFAVSGSQFIEMFVGLGPKRVRKLFRTARDHAPCIIFIDEIEALAHRRSGGDGAEREYDSAVTQVLTEMDGFGPSTGVFVLGATNKPDSLDEAVTREGRLDRTITVGLPTLENRKSILAVTIAKRNVKVADDVNDEGLQLIARATRQFSGAKLAELVNQAAIRATALNREAVILRDFEDALDAMLMGEPGALIVFDELRRQTARHEAGHAVSAYLQSAQSEVHHVSVRMNATSLGRVYRIPKSDIDDYTFEHLIGELAVILGGRAGEMNGSDSIAKLGAGVEDDLQRANELAASMVLKWGFGRRFGVRAVPVIPTRDGREDFTAALARLSDSAKEAAEADIRELLACGQENARRNIRLHQPFYDRIVTELDKSGELRLSDLNRLFAETQAA